MAIEINREVAAKVLSVVDEGLSSGLGKPKPGQMCVEAAVCYALGLPHGDDPTCVSPALRSLKITLNDKAWSSNDARAKGMRRLAIVQLGTAGELDDKAFVSAVAEMTIRVFVPIALRAAASMKGNAAHKEKLEASAIRCEKEGTKTASAAAAAAAASAAADAYAAASASYAADAADAAYAAAYASAASAAAAAAAASAAADAYAAAYASYAADAADAAYAAAYASAAAAAAASAAADAYAAAYASASYAADAAYARHSKSDSILSQFAEAVVQILVKMGVKSAAYLDLAPLDD